MTTFMGALRTMNSRNAIYLLLALNLIFLPNCEKTDSSEPTQDTTVQNLLEEQHHVRSSASSVNIGILKENHAIKILLDITENSTQLLKVDLVRDNPSIFQDDSTASPYVVTLISGEGKVLFSGGISDPLLVRYERENPEKPGVWEHKEYAQQKMQFWIKVPFRSGLKDLILHKRIFQTNGLKEIGRFTLSNNLGGGGPSK